jgi:DNA polymerase mu
METCAATVSSTTRFQCLSEFTKIYGIGPATAKDLYSRGLRTIEDLKRYYDLPPDVDPTQLGYLQQTHTKNTKNTTQENMRQITIPVGLALHDDLQEKIPREEVELIHKVVMEEVGHIREGCISTITGG